MGISRVGVFCGAASAVLYTAANVALKRVADVDAFLVSAIKAVPTVLFLLPVVGVFVVSKRPTGLGRTGWGFGPGGAGRFAAVALFGQFVGNAAFQIALGHIDLAIAVPITLGTLIVCGATFGWLLLGERVPLTRRCAMLVLLAAVAVLAIGSGSGATAGSSSDGTARIAWWGVGCASACGMAYALFGTVMRQTLSAGLSMPMTMLISGFVGTVALSSVAAIRVSPEQLASLDSYHWWVMAQAGLLNFVAFVALTASLRMLPVVAVNLINASQVALASAAGVWLFGERLTTSLMVGIAMTIGGLIVLTLGDRYDRRRTAGIGSAPDRSTLRSEPPLKSAS